MTKTSLKTKISATETGVPGNFSSNNVPDASEADFKAGDKFATSGQNRYKSLISGNIKASDSIVGDLMQEAVGRGSQRHYGGKKEFIRNTLMLGDLDKTKPTAPVVPTVPDLEEDLLKNVPNMANNMGIVAQNYESREKQLVDLIAINKENLKPPNSDGMSVDERSVLIKYGEDLEVALFNCRRGLEKTRRLNRGVVDEKA